MEVINNKRQYRYEVALEGGEPAILEYRWLRAKLLLMHTFVPDSARGKGVGGMLVKHVLDEARSKGLKVIVYCPFVEQYLKSHSGYDDIIEPRP